MADIGTMHMPSIRIPAEYPANAAELLGHEDIDGGLIGGASLDAGKFMDIVNAANQG